MPKQNLFVALDVPEGFELTGEYRRPMAWEWYLDSDGKQIGARKDCEFGPYPILRSLRGTQNTAPPHIDPSDKFVSSSGHYCFLRDIKDGTLIGWEPPATADDREPWTPPDWLPKGVWVYSSTPVGDWRVSKTEPQACPRVDDIREGRFKAGGYSCSIADIKDATGLPWVRPPRLGKHQV
jgi:hypothetical protein